MKKNKMMRLASILLVVTLLSTSVISGTFAKYTTQDSASDTARVAKWGVVLQATGDLYGATYKQNDGKPTNWTAETATGQSVTSASTANNLLAPGTQSDDPNTLSFKLNGKPEVASQTTVTITGQNIFLAANGAGDQYGLMVPVTGLTAENFVDVATRQGGLYTWSASGNKYEKVDTSTTIAPVGGTTYYALEDAFTLNNDYYPVVYKLSGTGATQKVDGTVDADSLQGIANEILKAVKTGAATNLATDTRVFTGSATSDTVNPNTELADIFGMGGQYITWAWAFDNDSCGVSGNGAGEMCHADTLLGNLNAGLTTAGGITACVVKGNDTNGYTVLVAPADGVTADYSLVTSFSIDITVSQMD